MTDAEKDVTHREVALLLADAAGGVEVRPAPCRAIVSGGRRRRARRLAVAAATALVIVGSTGTTLALTGAMGGGEGRNQVAQGSPAPVTPPAAVPQRTTLAAGRTGGKQWRVTVDVWAAPKDAAEASSLWTAMNDTEYLDTSRAGYEGRGLIGKGWYFVRLDVDGRDSFALDAPVEAGKDLHRSLRTGLASLGPRGSGRLVIGRASPDTERVVCTWDDGTTTEVSVAPQGVEPGSGRKPMLHTVRGSASRWFVAEVPQGRTFKSAEGIY
ncbi:hypothetical protein ACFVXE_37415 [Streptomyces sp. NPDC058231]|uniref:hypothetical protein n=1 Tax=Streptomyces sp. NPDC058231 TaxID=3346392 RepID=UPI0036EDDD9E